MRPCSHVDYARAHRRVHELGYPVGLGKWETFWAGFRAWAMGTDEADCPYPKASPETRAVGKLWPQRRGAWLHGFRAGSSPTREEARD